MTDQATEEMPEWMVNSKAGRVRKLVSESLYKDEDLKGLKPGEAPPGAVIFEGIMRKYGFDPVRLEANREKVRALIAETVPNEFLKSGGGGYTFLNLCVDRSGDQWAEHPTLDDFIALSGALGMAGFCMPRDFWSFLPGGVPYVWFDPTVGEQTAPTRV